MAQDVRPSREHRKRPNARQHAQDLKTRRYRVGDIRKEKQRGGSRYIAMHRLPLLRTTTPQLLSTNNVRNRVNYQEPQEMLKSISWPLTGCAQSPCLTCVHVTQGVVRVSKAWPELSNFHCTPRPPANTSHQHPYPTGLYLAATFQSLSTTGQTTNRLLTYISTMDRDRERDRDRRFVRPTPLYARQHSISATQCTHHAHLRQQLTKCRDDRYSNTYRPRSPRPRSRSPGPRVDSYRAGRSPPRRSSPPPRRGSPPRRGLASADTYTPGGASRPSRPRSRSPVFRRRSRSPRRDDNWRARPRSPPRRNFSPRRDDYRNDRARSPRRDGYDSYTRSPRPRDRSPPPRTREASPARSRGMRSPVRVSRYDEPRSRINRYA